MNIKCELCHDEMEYCGGSVKISGFGKRGAAPNTTSETFKCLKCNKIFSRSWVWKDVTDALGQAYEEYQDKAKEYVTKARTLNEDS